MISFHNEIISLAVLNICCYILYLYFPNPAKVPGGTAPNFPGVSQVFENFKSNVADTEHPGDTTTND